MQEAMYAELVHDLRMPLQVVCSCAQLIGQEADGMADIQPYVEMLTESAQQLQRMLANFLEEERAGAALLRASRGNLAGCVKGLCGQYAVVALKRNIALSLRANTAALEMYFDEEKLVRIVQNLLSNALNWTPEGGWVRVELEAMGDFVELRVRDSGPGVPPGDRERIFGRMQGDGCGLGLYIARTYARLHGGDLRAEGRADEGGVFVLRLPVRGEMSVARETSA